MTDQLATSYRTDWILAEHARTATTFGRCVLCGHAYDRGHRIADLADHTGKAHVGCIGQDQQ